MQTLLWMGPGEIGLNLDFDIRRIAGQTKDGGIRIGRVDLEGPLIDEFLSIVGIGKVKVIGGIGRINELEGDILIPTLLLGDDEVIAVLDIETVLALSELPVIIDSHRDVFPLPKGHLAFAIAFAVEGKKLQQRQSQ